MIEFLNELKLLSNRYRFDRVVAKLIMCVVINKTYHSH